MKLIVAVVFLLISQFSFANDKTIIVAERSTAMGLEQVGIVIQDNDIQYTANSNFLYQKLPYPIGLFQIKKRSDFSKYVNALTKPEVIKEKTMQSPHGLKVYVNGQLISHESKKTKIVQNLVNAIASDRTLKAKGGVIIRNSQDLKNIKCTAVTEKVCEFKFGYIHK